MIFIGLVVVIAAIVVGVYLYRKRQDKGDFQSEPHSNIGEGGMSTTRQVWFYLVIIITLAIFAVGVGQLLTLIFDVTIKGSYLTQVGVANFNKQQLSLGLAMILIGGPLWFFFWRSVQRRVKGNQEEIGAAIRKFFLNFILVETAIMGITAASSFLKWLMAGARVAEFSSSVLAVMIVGGIVWFYHWRISESEGHPSPVARTLRRWYVYILSGFGLVWLSVGLVLLVNTVVINLPVWGNILVREHFWDNATQMSVAQLLLGGVTWYYHWFRMARNDFDSTLRQVYFYLLTISGGAIAALAASTIILYQFFIWVFGGVNISVSPHFQFLGWAVPTALVGLAIWGYHRRLVQEEANRVQEKRQSAQRVYFYLMSFLGLGTLVAGLSWLFGILIDLIINAAGTSLIVATGWWRNQLALCLALLIIGAPLWVYFWNGILKRVQAGGIEEWRALSRRIFLYVTVGASIIILAADLVNIIYQLLSSILQGNFGVDVLRNSKWSLQTLIVAAPLIWYHWRILRTEQRRGAETAVVQRNVTLLVDDRKGELASQLESKLGFKIHLLFHAGQASEGLPALPDEEIERLANEIRSSPSNKILVVALGSKMTVLPYQDR
jgi:hypothetical protein